MPQQQQHVPDDKRRGLTTAVIGGVISGIVRAVAERVIEHLTRNT